MSEALFRALADPSRRRILQLLKRKAMPAGEIAEAFDMTKGALSHHFNILKAADLVRAERRGQQIVYSLNASVFEETAAMLAELFKLDARAKEKANAIESGRSRVAGVRGRGPRRRRAPV